MLVARDDAECEIVGEGQADIVGIGIIVGFVGQALISLSLACWVFFLSKHGRLEIHHSLDDDDDPAGRAELAIERKRLECVSDILMVGNDSQMLLGASLMITVFASAATTDLYHLHLVFDIVSFVGPSSAAALVCWTFCNARLRPPAPPASSLRRRLLSLRARHWTPRHRAVYYFSAMYAALLVLTAARLGAWSPTRCYHARLVTAPAAPHPAPDRAYVVLTGAANLAAMLAAALAPARWRHSVLLAAALQFPVHLYMALALRAANQGRLEPPEIHENGWDFGQTTAVVLLAMALREVATKAGEFYRFERAVKLRRLKSRATPTRSLSRSRSRSRSHDDVVVPVAADHAALEMQEPRSDEAGRVEQGPAGAS